MLFGRVTVDDRIRGNVAGNHRPGSDQSVLANRITADDGCIGTNAGTLPDPRGQIIFTTVSREGRTRRGDAGKDDGRAAEQVIVQRHTLVN